MHRSEESLLSGWNVETKGNWAADMHMQVLARHKF